MTACLRAEAMPSCPIDGFYPASNTRANIDSAVADPKPKIVRDDEQLWFDYIEVDGRFEPGWQHVYEVAVLRSDKGGFRVVLLRVKSASRPAAPGPGVVDSRDLPATIAQRLHRGVIPILARTHYPAELFEKSGLNDVVCTDGSWLDATVAETGGPFDELVGEARPRANDTDAGAVQVLGQALRDYALRRIDEEALAAPLKLVEAHAKPDDSHGR